MSVRTEERERALDPLELELIGASEPPAVGAGNQTALEDQWFSYFPSAVTRHRNQSVYSSRAKIHAHHDEEDGSRQQTECWAVREGELEWLQFLRRGSPLPVPHLPPQGYTS